MKRKALMILVIAAMVLPVAVHADPGSLTGRVTDSNNIPIPDTKVELLGTELFAFSDADGYYTIEEVENGTYTIYADPPVESGFVAATIPNVVVDGDTIRDIVLVKATFVLSGTVTDLDTGLPVYNASVQVWNTGFNKTVYTDSNGEYAMSGLTAGFYNIRARKADYYEDYDVDVEITGHTENYHMFLEPIPPVPVSDVTFRLLNEDGTPIRTDTCTDVRGYLWNLDTGMNKGWNYSDETGRITFEDMEHGRIRLRLYHYCRWTFDDDGDSSTPNEDVYRYFNAEYAYFDLTENIDLGDFVIPFVDVTYEVISDQDDPVNSAYTNDSNWYRSIDNPVYGNNVQFNYLNGYMRVVNTGGDNRATISLVQTREDANGDPNTNVNLWVYPPGSNTTVEKKYITGLNWIEDKTVTLVLPTKTTFDGTVTGSHTGLGDTGWRIRISGNNTNYDSAIAADGSFHFEVPPGSYSIQIWGWEAAYTADAGGDSGKARVYFNVSASPSIDLQSPTVKHFVIPFTLGGSATVVNTAGEPVNGARVYAESYKAATFVTDGHTFNGSAYFDFYAGDDNHYEGVTGLAAYDPANHNAHYYDGGAGYPYQYFYMDVPDDGHWQLTVSRATVQGQIKLHDGTPLVRVAGQSTFYLRYYGQNSGQWYYAGYLDEDGRYSINPMLEDNYRVYTENRWHYFEYVSGDKWSRSRIYTDWAQGYTVPIAGDAVRDWTLNTRWLTINVQDQWGVPVPNSTVYVSGGWGEPFWDGDTYFQYGVYIQAEAKLGASGATRFAVGRTREGSTLSIDVRPPGDSGYESFVLYKPLREDTTVTIILTLDTSGPDSDHDGVLNDDDNCIGIPNPNQEDWDEDGLGDACDPDDDNDVLGDDLDPDDHDPDVDDDGVLDGADNCVSNPNADQADNDEDGQGDVCDPDDDNDGVADGSDNCPLVYNPGQDDEDGNGIGDACDVTDSDEDGVDDDEDNCPMTANPGQEDNDEDGAGDVCDDDDDNDGVLDNADNCPMTANPGQEDNDEDGAGDVCDDDDDNDGVLDNADNCPMTANPGQEDNDEDGAGDACDDDDDNDGVLDNADNCPMTANPGQEDNDEDGAGDACDDDDDNDGVLDNADNCPMTANPGQEDNDEDGAGDVCDDDDDNDGVLDNADNCPMTANPGQEDNDEDGAGDVCDDDDDNDGVLDNADNCPMTANPEQEDFDGDGLGDACDPDDDNDGVDDGFDVCWGTLIPESVPTVELKPNRWALTDDDDPFDFDTVSKGRGNGPGRSYTTTDTAGCSCEQIIAAQGLGEGHTKHGCSISAMDDWVALVNP